MGIFDKVGSFIRREAKDLGDAADGVKDKFDQELTKREQELEMTPSEKIAALQQQAAASDANFDAIADKATGRTANADAVAEVGDLPADVSLPNVTHIVLPDGRVKSGASIDKVAEAGGTVHEIPLVQAPTHEDLSKPETAAASPDSTPESPTTQAVPVAPAHVPVTPAEPAAPLEPAAQEPVTPAEPAAPLEPAAQEPVVPSEPTAPLEPTAQEPVVSVEPSAPADDHSEVPNTAQASAEVDVAAPASDSVEEPETTTAAPSSDPGYDKTPAQIKYELAREAANDLLDELRGELKGDGEI